MKLGFLDSGRCEGQLICARLLPIACACLIATALPVRATVIQVDCAGGGDYPTIQEGVDAASAGDTVVVACGVYRERITIARDIVLRSVSGDPECVTIDAELLGRVCTCHDLGSTSLIEGITFANGHVGEYIPGAGMKCIDCSHTMRSCVFANNSTEWNGGGLYLAHSSLQMEDCSFIGNTAGIWGGAVDAQYSSLSALGCLFSGNSALHGGGLSCHQSSQLTLDYCTLSENTASYGGGIDCFTYSTCEVRNTTFWANSASLGGGMRVGVSDASLQNTIIAHGTSGEAIYCMEGDVALVCCDVFGNQGGDWVGCIAEQLNVNDNICSDPLFCYGENPDNPLALHADSPCSPSNSPCGALIGAIGVGCVSTPTSTVSWGVLKALYRRPQIGASDCGSR